MYDPRDLSAFWGLCGGLIAGAIGMLPAYASKGATAEARTKAWLSLGIGVFAGPVAAEALASAVAAAVPVMAKPAVALVAGYLAANDPRAFFNFLGRIFKAALKAAIDEKEKPS
ncbi:hypothetical protein ASG17_07500 [Brevundimonas sp. Leaf363]|uniref:hypothetical protein n=1 Tax=Brevundimonas sp. Leaf363 TaxID=1736353 RepID=UPI0006F8AF4F|nr:hypothetical protein [Brevundimonas sp. Leaf363]KQS55886.1 hypothetical protein ASG17_07500 [Brevundimonas sp. Leaf363]